VSTLYYTTPDLIGLQEVKLPEDNSAWLAQQLNMPYVQIVPYKGLDDIGFPKYGAAILRRHPFTKQDTLDLQTSSWEHVRFARGKQGRNENRE
jgi:hypothetical protein